MEANVDGIYYFKKKRQANVKPLPWFCWMQIHGFYSFWSLRKFSLIEVLQITRKLSSEKAKHPQYTWLLRNPKDKDRHFSATKHCVIKWPISTWNWIPKKKVQYLDFESERLQMPITQKHKSTNNSALDHNEIEIKKITIRNTKSKSGSESDLRWWECRRTDRSKKKAYHFRRFRE